MRELLFSGKGFTEGQTWQFYRANYVPCEELCTAVAVVIFTDPELEELILIDNDRGTEPVAGHIEQGETLEETAQREALEEAGAVLGEEVLHFFGFTEVHTSPSAEGHDRYGPLTYIPVFWCVYEGEFVEPTGDDAFGFQIVSTNSVERHVPSGLSQRNQTLMNFVIDTARKQVNSG